MAERYFIGLMSGTSVDAIDAALVDFTGDTPRCIAASSYPIDAALKNEILHACRQRLKTANEASELDQTLARRYAAASQQLLEQAGLAARDVIAIGCHGQTVHHAPAAKPPFSLQLGNAQLLADLTGIPVISDFRRADIETGGQGAPLVPAFHNAVLRSHEQDRVVANIGGMANITFLPMAAEAAVRGFDTGPGNVLMDEWIKRHKNMAYDANGEWAASGKVNRPLLARMLEDDYFRRPPPKSTGREHFNLLWLDERLNACQGLAAEDVQATLCELTAATLCLGITLVSPGCQQLILCGGGAHNKELLRRLARHLPGCRIRSSDEFGIHPDFMEAIAFAWLTHRHLNGQSGNLPSVTGAKCAVVLGERSLPG